MKKALCIAILASSVLTLAGCDWMNVSPSSDREQVVVETPTVQPEQEQEHSIVVQNENAKITSDKVGNNEKSAKVLESAKSVKKATKDKKD